MTNLLSADWMRLRKSWLFWVTLALAALLTIPPFRAELSEAGRICADVVYGFDAATPEDKAAFAALRAKLDESLAGTSLAKDRAAKALTTIMIPEALDYPL